MRHCPLLIAIAGVMMWIAFDRPIPAAAPPAEAEAKGAADSPAAKGREGEGLEKAIVSGRVVRLAAAFKELEIASYEPEIKDQVVLVTPSKELIPIVPDWRGRAFYQDERLRERPVDLLVHRRKGVPWVQVMSVYTFDEKGTRNITDYWCDVCSIPMYEIKECECCQGPIRLRFRPQDLPPLTETNGVAK